jgi:hypothetical protein
MFTTHYLVQDNDGYYIRERQLGLWGSFIDNSDPKRWGPWSERHRRHARFPTEEAATAFWVRYTKRPEEPVLKVLRKLT